MEIALAPGTRFTPETNDPTRPETAIAADIRAAMSTVVDPELGIDLATLRLVQEVEWTGSALAVRFVFTTPFCPYGPALMAEMERALHEVLLVPFALVLLPQAYDPPDEVKSLIGLPGYW